MTLMMRLVVVVGSFAVDVAAVIAVVDFSSLATTVWMLFAACNTRVKGP